MQLTGYEDLRVQKTISAIQTAFSQMLFEMEYSKMTVKELCQRAKKNKKTFYHYYENLDDLLAEYQSAYAAQFLSKIADYTFPDDIEKFIRAFFEFSAEQDKTYERITIAGAYQSIRQDMIDMVTSSTYKQSDFVKKLPLFYQEAFLKFWNITVLELYRQWVESKESISLEEIISLTTQLVCNGLSKFVMK